jgi:hypothetical protein
MLVYLFFSMPNVKYFSRCAIVNRQFDVSGATDLDNSLAPHQNFSPRRRLLKEDPETLRIGFRKNGWGVGPCLQALLFYS